METADNYVGTHPFTDVFPWADKYVAVCYSSFLIFRPERGRVWLDRGPFYIRGSLEDFTFL